MPVTLTLDQILHLAPNARSSYREAFQNGQPLLDQFGISDTPLRLAHFMAQVLHESDGLANQIESLNYSAERLPKSGRRASSRPDRSTRPTSPTTSKSSAMKCMAAEWETPVRTTASRIVDEASCS